MNFCGPFVGRAFTRDQLLDAVWHESHFVTLRSIDVFVRRLGEKIEPNPERPVYLKTVRGVGTALIAATGRPRRELLEDSGGGSRFGVSPLPPTKVRFPPPALPL